MGNDQLALQALFACESGISEFAWCPVWKKTTAKLL
jgi:hypothetical protein